ncbi:ribonuclease 1-like [Oryza brachyantha]|uniref:Uncharacterized protein n=1 Tax=Oryza brachyantha TaxID=4533 RepID=J3MZK8_ORYBR|nr:ribonuclease 1-like [Oryza brachyantha]
MGSSRIALLCLVGLLVVAASPVAIADEDDKIFYQITFMWPGAYCSQSNAGCCMPKGDVVPASDFYVAGFTVYNARTNSPMTRCDNTPFNMNQLGDTTELKKYWNNIRCPSSNSERSWKKAWETSGVCSNLTESAYFDTALAIRDKINPLARLASNDIKPDFGLYSVEKIKEALEAGTGAPPLIQCSRGPQRTYQLYQIYVCVAQDGETFVECPAPKKPYTCSDRILFHTFKEWMLKNSTNTNSAYAAEAIDQLLQAAMEI